MPELIPFARLLISIADQRLYAFTAASELPALVLACSTALNGAGEQEGSGCTPRGRHVIAECIGGELPVGAVLRARLWTGEICTPELMAAHPGRDWILTRILWLDGCEPGVNQGGAVDTHARYIYIHGTPDSEPMGVPLSHGCIRLRNAVLPELFERVASGCPVEIIEAACPQWHGLPVQGV